MIRSSRRAAIAGAALLALSGKATRGQAAPEVDLALVLAVDASGSVDQGRFELQRRGYAEAFANPRIIAAIGAGERRAIAVAMFQWTGPDLQAEVTPWRRIDSAASARALAALIGETPRHLFSGGTSISGAIDHAVAVLGALPWRAARRVIDVSGDGQNNIGRPADRASAEAVRAGIVINGLPILALDPGLADYYRERVIGGPGSFVIAAASFDDFGKAIEDKLVAEIAGVPSSARWAV